jgi:hypothetical protein
MSNCSNPIHINTANVDYFGFKATYKPYEKQILLDIANYTSFKTGGAANITSIAFTITSPTNETFTAVINPSLLETSAVVIGLGNGQTYFGNYKIVAVLTEANASTYSLTIQNNICFDNRMNSLNYINASKTINAIPDCNVARMIISDLTDYKYAAMDSTIVVYDGAIVFPNQYQPQLNISYLPYSLNLANSITGIYQIQMLAYAEYALECGSVLQIQYRSQLYQDVMCGANMCQLTCCWMDSLAIVERGGTQGAMMQDKMNEAEKYYNAAFLLYTCGKANDREVNKVREILNCDCRCSDTVLIQPKPIVYAGANMIGNCGTTINVDENGDVNFHSFVYTFKSGTGSGINVNTVQVNECVKETTITLNIEEVEDLLYTYISENSEILTKWQELFISTNSCTGDVEISYDIDSLNLLPSDLGVTAPLNFTNSHSLNILYLNNDIVLPSGSTLKYFRITSQKLGIAATTDYLPIDGAGFSANVCLNQFEDAQICVEVETSKGCYAVKNCTLLKVPVDYSTRFAMPYRFNPQINDLPIMPDPNADPLTDKGILYFADTLFKDSSSSWGTIIRKINLNTGEVTTISGKSGQQVSTKTINNTLGDEVVYGYGSTIILDKNELHNGEPVIYMGTFGKSASEGGVVCRIVKESNCCGCDERKNWRTFVLVNPTNAFISNPPIHINETGDNVILKNTYGIKRWLDVDGDKISFYIKNADLLYHLYYSGSGSMDNASNWLVNTVYNDPTDINPFSFGAGADNSNINVENCIVGEGDESYRLIILYKSTIEFLEWAGSIPPTVSDCRYLNSNTRYDIICSTAIGTTDGGYDITGSCNQTPSVYNPTHIYHFDNGTTEGIYIVGQNGFSGAIAPSLRTIVFDGTDEYNYQTLTLQSATGAVGTTGDLSLLTTNGLSGGFFVDLQGNLIDYTYGGFRLWKLDLGYCELLFGGDSASATQTQYAQLAQPLRCDSQFTFELNC